MYINSGYDYCSSEMQIVYYAIVVLIVLVILMFASYTFQDLYD